MQRENEELNSLLEYETVRDDFNHVTRYLFYDITRYLLTLLVSFFFREVHSRSSHRIPHSTLSRISALSNSWSATIERWILVIIQFLQTGSLSVDGLGGIGDITRTTDATAKLKSSTQAIRAANSSDEFSSLNSPESAEFNTGLNYITSSSTASSKTTGLIFVLAPHKNQFVDPIILWKHCGLYRRVGFLVAKKSYNRPLVGFFARLVNSLPVTRPQDEAWGGKGQRVFCKSCAGDRFLFGYGGTKFTQDLPIHAGFEDNSNSLNSSTKSKLGATRSWWWPFQKSVAGKARKRLSRDSSYGAQSSSAKVNFSESSKRKSKPSDSAKSKLSDQFYQIALKDGTIISYIKDVLQDDVIELSQPLPAAVYQKLLVDDDGDNEKLEESIRSSKSSFRGMSFKFMPHIDQSSMYKAVHDRLNEGGSIGIFPEGGSHDRSDLLPLKAGVSIMALGAMAENPNLEVKIIPCGLHYFHPNKFRSRASIDFGNSITPTDELIQAFKLGGMEKRQAITALLRTIQHGLTAVTVSAPDYETLQVSQAARRLYRPISYKLSVSQKTELTRRFAEGYSRLKHDEDVQMVSKSILEYNRLLKAYGILDHQVNKTALDANLALRLLIFRVLKLVIVSLAALPGVVLNLPVIILAEVVSANKAKEALANSSVKLTGQDVLATWKLIVLCVFYPVMLLFYASIAAIISHSYSWYFTPITTFLLTLVMFPSLTYATVLFSETHTDLLKSLRPLIMCITNRMDAGVLRRMREQLRRDIGKVVVKFGPDVFEDFEEKRVVPNELLSDNEFSTDASVSSLPSYKDKERAASLFDPSDVDEEDMFHWKQITSEEVDDVFFPGETESLGSSIASSIGENLSALTTD